MKEKIKSYDFWTAIASAVFVVLQAIGFKEEIPYLNEMTTAFLSILAIGGLIVKPPAKQEETVQADDETSEENQDSFADKIIDNTK